MPSLIETLNKALKGKTGSNSGNFRHENEAAIIDAAKKLLIKSSAGQELLKFAESHQIEIHVLRNKQDFGFLPSKSVVYISCPAGQSMPTARAVLHLAGALRDCMQDLTTDDLRRPAVSQGIDIYKKTYTDKKIDQIFWQCAVAHDIVMATGLSEIIDELSAMGYRQSYEGYVLDLQTKSS